MKKIFYQTTPIYYVNDVPHIGHAYTTIAADTLARARRLQGHDVFFLTGTDEHGQNIERTARERGIPEKEYCDQISARFRDLWEKLGIRYDGFIRTTDEIHRRGVLKLWGRLVEAQTPDGRPAIYKDRYAGWYCPRCEAFKDEDDLRQPGNLCADHERPCEWTEEENFFFRLSAYADWLQAEIESGRIRIDPDGRRNEVLAVLRQGLKDFSVSRARVKWGIAVPQDPSHVLYVWVDALSNYVTALEYADEGADYKKYWQGSHERLHFIGKEIIRFHCLYWPALLHAAGLPVPTRFFAHGWLTKDGRKLSKTTGNVIDPDAFIGRFGSDAARYFLLREGSFGQDLDVTDAAFLRRYNSDLANDLGNLVSRGLTMVSRYCDGKVPFKGLRPPGVPFIGLEDLIAHENEPFKRALDGYEDLAFSSALGEIWSWVGRLNQRIVERQPWELAKDPSRRAELDTFLYDLIEAIRLIAVLVSPVMPEAARRIYAMLGLRGELGPADLEWGRLEPGADLGPLEPLFPRAEKPGVTEAKAASTKEKTVSESKPPATAPPPSAAAPEPTPTPTTGGGATPAAASAASLIDIADFAKLDLRSGVVKSAERIPKTDKLLKLQVDLGEEVRQVVAGIAEAYAPEALVGRRVVVVANLKPARLRGVDSNGMVLAASIDGRAVLCTFDEDVPPGTKVK